MIEVEKISKRFGEIEALRNVSFTVQKGHVVGFLGANGAGKTTTMDILCGCIGPDSGRVSIAGFDITEQPKQAKKRLGYLPDEPPLHNDMRVDQFITYSARIRGVPGSEVKTRVNEVIDQLSLGDVKARLVGNLSKGFRQRVGLAQCLVHKPDVLVLDEPTEGLDPSQIIHIRDLIKSWRSDHTIILSSHILSEVESICDEIVIIDKGQIVEKGSYNDLVSRAEAGRYQLRVRQGAEALLPKLQGLTGLSGTNLFSKEKNIIEFHAQPSSSVLDEIALLAVNGGYGLCEISQKSKSLEDIFLQLTHKNEEVRV
ncbi:MAG: ABC transporter ATP-binding protein [Oligoflexales bacterium]